MEISSLTISKDLTKLELIITDAADVSILRFWNDSTYKNFGELIDLSSKLTGNATQEIDILLSDIGEEYFDGIYFIEVEDSDESAVEYVATLRKYEECMMDKLNNWTACDSCPTNEVENNIISTNALIMSLEGAIEHRFIDEMLNIKKMLDKICSDDCKTCGQYGNIVDATTDNANYDPITIKIDGGEL